MKRRTTDRKLTLREAFDRYYDKTDLSPKTLEHYGIALKRWEKHAGNPPVGKATDQHAQKMRDGMLTDGLKPVTVNSDWAALRAMFRKIGPRFTGNPGGLEIIQRVPYLKRLKTVRKKPRRLSMEELSAFYLACGFATYPKNGVPAPAWWRALVTTAYSTALRKSDLLGMVADNIDVKNRTAEVTARKTGKADTFPLSHAALRHLRAIARPGKRLFAGVGWNGSRFHKLWNEIVERSGIQQRFTLHDIRKTAASEAERVRHGAASMILQHARHDVTGAYYLNMADELRDVVDRMRQPTAFVEGPDVMDRAKLLERLREVQDNVKAAIIEGVDPDEWEFRPGAFRYCGGEWIALRGCQWRFLKALAKLGKPLSVAEFAAALYGEDCDVDLDKLKRNIATQVSGLRRKLRGWFGLPDDVDPVPCLDRKNPTWTLYLPAESMDERDSQRDDDAFPTTAVSCGKPTTVAATVGSRCRSSGASLTTFTREAAAAAGASGT